jgi:nucleoside-diphosphate-sugar epimerase
VIRGGTNAGWNRSYPVFRWICATGMAFCPAAIVHSAAQPSHDLAAKIPYEEFDTNAVGTINVLEAARRFVPTSPFVHMSTNKVYGDAFNELAVMETETRWEYTRLRTTPELTSRCGSINRLIRYLAYRRSLLTSWFKNMGATS